MHVRGILVHMNVGADDFLGAPLSAGEQIGLLEVTICLHPRAKLFILPDLPVLIKQAVLFEQFHRERVRKLKDDPFGNYTFVRYFALFFALFLLRNRIMNNCCAHFFNEIDHPIFEWNIVFFVVNNGAVFLIQSVDKEIVFTSFTIDIFCIVTDPVLVLGIQSGEVVKLKLVARITCYILLLRFSILFSFGHSVFLFRGPGNSPWREKIGRITIRGVPVFSRFVQCFKALARDI